MIQNRRRRGKVDNAIDTFLGHLGGNFIGIATFCRAAVDGAGKLDIAALIHLDFTDIQTDLAALAEQSEPEHSGQ